MKFQKQLYINIFKFINYESYPAPDELSEPAFEAAPVPAPYPEAVAVTSPAPKAPP
jgi:hypothetical protein